MSKALTVHVKEAFFVPISQLTEDEVQQAIQDGTFQFFKDSQCERCEFYQDRPTDTCEGCPANQGIVRTVKRVTKKDRPYLSLPLGYPKAVKRLADGREVEYKVHFPIVPMRSSPEFTGKLWHYQTPAVKSLIEKKRGVLKSKPRTGKTVMAAAAVCKLRLKTIILAAQHDWLANFYETFVGSESQKAMTTISKKRCGFARKLEDFEKYDVALATYQQFLSPKGQKLLKKISSMFSVLVVDECFTYGHRLRTEKGLVAIGDIVRGHVVPRTVLSYNHKTGREEFKRLESVTEKSVTRLVKVTIQGRQYLCTPNHEFWSESRGEYVQAQDLIRGETVLLRPSK